MRNYTKIQKYLSFLLIFSILFSFTIHISFFSFVGKIFAGSNDHFNVVSILVQDEIYGDVASEVKRYASDIQKVIPNTKTMIVPVSSQEHPFNIASLLEKLYFEGYTGIAGLNGDSNLIGTVFVGDIALPVVDDNGVYEKTILPYTDFENKLYVYNQETKRFSKNSNFSGEPKVEIWHGFISPNTGDLDKDVDQIVAYFDKNHDFYTAKGDYAEEKGVMNGANSEVASDYEPYVFYYDQIREFQALNYVNFKAYEQYGKNIEALAYDRYSKELANVLKTEYAKNQGSSLSSLGTTLGGIDFDAMSSGPDPSKVPDILTRHIINNSVKKFPQIFNPDALGEMRKDVHNAGRYNSGATGVNVDLIPQLVGQMDTFAESILKNVNTDLEKEIDTLVKNGLSRNMAVLTDVHLKTNSCGGEKYINFFYGTQASSITGAQDCTIYRGNNANSGTLVQSNRAFNLDLVQQDAQLCVDKTDGYWGGNSPLNIDRNSFSGMDYVLKSSYPERAISPLYDIKGQKKSLDNSKLSTPLNCYQNGLILIRKDETRAAGLGCRVDYEVPFGGRGGKDWSCETINQLGSYTSTFDQDYIAGCSGKSIVLDGQNVCGSASNDEYKFKKILSVIEHKSPTQEELITQIKNQKTPNLPIDTDRYVDFVTTNGAYEKITYPFLFRLKTATGTTLSLKNIDILLQDMLNKKSNEINTLVAKYDPSTLSAKQKELYDMLKTGDYPSDGIDLYENISKKPTQKIEVLGDTKDLSYLEVLKVALYWNNLPSVSSKYKFIYEYQLGDQMLRDDFAFFLPKNKKLYEMSYFSVPGDGNNMFVKMDGEDKGQNPYADLLAKNQELKSNLSLLEKNTTGAKEGAFKCAPPDGVPLQEWLPAINCWLDDMLPPDFGFKSGSCGTDAWFSFEDSSFFDRYEGQGILAFLQSEFYGGYLRVTSDSPRCGYNKNAKIQVTAYSKDNEVLAFDNFSQVTFQVARVEVPQDETLPLSNTNKKLIYDDRAPLGSSLFNDRARKEVAKYIDFKEVTTRLKAGSTTFSYTSKNRDANVEFRVKLNLYDSEGNPLVQKNEYLTVNIRGDSVGGNFYHLSKYNNQDVLNPGIISVAASKSTNIFLSSINKFQSLQGNLKSLSSVSGASEKLFITLANQTPKGVMLPLELPVEVKISQDNRIIKSFTLTDESKLYELAQLSQAGEYTLTLIDVYGQQTQKVFRVLPDEVESFEVNLGTNLMEKDAGTTTHLVKIYDAYKNLAVGVNTDVEVSIDGEGVTFEDGTKVKKLQVFEGYKKFTLKTTGKTGTAKLNFALKRDNKSNLTIAKNISVVDEIKFEVKLSSANLAVGEKSYNYTLSVAGANPQTNFESRAYFAADSVYFKSANDYVKIVNNSGTGTFFTTNKAIENTQLVWHVEGVKKPVTANVSVRPDLPIRVNLTLDRSMIEASPSGFTQLRAELKDRYENTVFTDNSSNVSVKVEGGYQKIISVQPGSKTAVKGKSTFIVRATDVPGTAFFQVETSPSLEQNRVEVAGQTKFLKKDLTIPGFKNQDGTLSVLGNTFFYEYDSTSYRSKFPTSEELKASSDFKALPQSQQTRLLNLIDSKNKIIFSGLSKNVGKIETYYFWNAQKLKDTHHNSLYATLLGANYGDITQKNNLANALIFEPTSKTLGVTSLISQYKRQNQVVKASQAGGVNLNLSSADISQDVSEKVEVDSAGNMSVSFFNNTFSKLITKIYYNFVPKNLSLVSCAGVDFANCFDEDTTSVVLKSLDPNYILKTNEVSGHTLSSVDGKEIFAFSPSGNVKKANFVELKTNKNYKDFGALDISINGKNIGILAFGMKKSQILVTRDNEQIQSVKNMQSQGGLVVYLENLDYVYKNVFTGASTNESSGIAIIYNDPFASDTTQYPSYISQFPSSYETSLKQKSLGWAEENKTLLSFAAGKSIGEATQDYASFGLINIGDPVVSLKPIPKNLPGKEVKRKFDATIGTLISKDPENIGFSTFDYNADGKTDLLILKKGGMLELREGTGNGEKFLEKGNLVHIVDYKDSASMVTGDFTGDRFEDFALLNKDGQVVLFNNFQKDFVRLDTKNTFQLKGKVMQLFSFDMDNDGKSDLVTYDDAGEVNIFYGGGVANAPKFTKKTVMTGWGAKLSQFPRNDGGLVYFSGIYQLPKSREMSVVKSSEELQSQVNANVQNLINNPNGSNPFQTTGKKLNEALIDNLMFRNISYTHPTENIVPENLRDLNNEQYNYFDNTKTFTKSEYALGEGISVSKTYTDLNGGNIQQSDEVILNISVKNIGNTTKQNLVYGEKIPDVFEIDTTKLPKMIVDGREVTGSGVLMKKFPTAEYSFLIDQYNLAGRDYSLTLSPGESFTLSVPLKTKAFQGGFIEVGLFEEGEAGDDMFGDIAMKMKQQSCALPYRMLRSTQAREYSEGEKELVCEKGLPEEIEKNQKDENKNGIPDYIDQLIADGKAGNTSYKDFANEALGEFLKDSDMDGIPDDEDDSPYYNDSEDFMSRLDQLNYKVDELVAGMDNFMDGLSCGFGGGACLSLPMNRAPLAPGNDPVLFGMPIGDGLHPYEGIPVFSAVTMCGIVPGVWPPCPTGAGGIFGYAPGPYRLFITPTLTGAVGVAMCFGDNAVAGYSPAPGISPLTPGGNCIVMAKPLIGCKDDGSDGEIFNVTLPAITTGDYGVINGNCNAQDNGQTQNFLIPPELAEKYLNYKKTGYREEGLLDGFDDLLSDGYTKINNNQMLPTYPLFTFAEGNEGSDFSLTLDNSSIGTSDFSDIVDIQMERVGAFPDFLMDWVRRQIEEIVNKLTSFPTLFIILPDFSGVFEGFENFTPRLEESFEEGKEERKNVEQNIDVRVQNLLSQKSQLNCESEEDKVNCLYYDIQIANLEREKTFSSGNQVMSGVRGVYEFLGSLPMISITPEVVNVNVPWVDASTLNKAILEWELASEQWKDEWNRVKTSGGWNQYNCVGTPSDAEECRVILDIENLIYSLDRNIEILKSYKEFPERLNEMLRIKEIRLDQILCNVEIISEVVGGWIGENGQRFRAWVELYILVKAILKSWQVFIDIFLDYEAECFQCKNERNDLQYFTWKLISGVIPSMPIIQFPKWPDIYMDLHNIRVGVNVSIPDFHFNLRPILIPRLPDLYLPDAPYVNLRVPTLPLLPEYSIPELPEIPSLPSVELPDLPPPPRLPKLFGSLEGFLNILKLITKAMCILKFNPFVPEWRAGDQIAYLTERSGYLSTDFLDISLPQFSYPAIDAIKITTWVNLEFETEFLTEAARQATLPLNIFTNNVVNYLNIGINDFDLSSQVPSEINVELDEEGDTNADFGYDSKKSISVFDFAMLFAKNIPKLHSYLDTQGKVPVSNAEFKQMIATELGKKSLHQDPSGQKLAHIWDEALQYSFEKEDKTIADLQQKNTQKFDALENILKTEIKNVQQEKTALEKLLQAKPKETTLISSQKTDFDAYNKQFENYNIGVLESAVKLQKPDAEVTSIRQSAKDISSQIDAGLNSFDTEISTAGKEFVQAKNEMKSQLLAVGNILTPEERAEGIGPSIPSASSTTSASSSSLSGPSAQSCKVSGGSGYTYKGIYIVEEFLGQKISYRLFDYIDQLTGKEVLKSSDVDGDSDEDMFYMVGSEIYFKENYLAKAQTLHWTGSPVVVDFADTDFAYGGFLPAVNNFSETVSESGFINMSFVASSKKTINNYRIEFYNIVDKMSHELNNFAAGYLPVGAKKYIIDSFADIENSTLLREKTANASYTLRNNLAYINTIGNLGGVELRTKEIRNIALDINEKKQVILNTSSILYAGNNDVSMVYYLVSEKDNPEKFKKVVLNKYTNIQFHSDIVVVSLSNEAYVEGNSFVTLRGNEMIPYVKKPLFPGTKILYSPNEKNVSAAPANLTIEYYDGSEAELDFDRISGYEIYDLGNADSNYLVRTEMQNDYYYAKIQSFQGNVFSAQSNQVLLSPQKESDKTSPNIDGLSRIKVPVYQEVKLDITDFIYENSGVTNLKNIFIDFDLNIDTSGDGNTFNDPDMYLGGTNPKLRITNFARTLKLEMGPFDEIFARKIRLYLVDQNNNIGYKDIDFEVYAPIPNISKVSGTLVEGKLNEKLENEPVTLYRLRGGNLSRLSTRNAEISVDTDVNGNFTFITGKNKDGLELRYRGEAIATINEYTGKIEGKKFGDFDIVVYPSKDPRNPGAQPKISFLYKGNQIYEQYIALPNSGMVQKVDDLIEAIEGKIKKSPGMYYKNTSNDFASYAIPLNVPQNAGDMIIYDVNDKTKTPIFTLFKDGRIVTKSTSYTIEYATMGDYVVLKLLDKTGPTKEVGRVLLIPEENFVVE